MKVKEAISRYKILGELYTYQDYLELPDDGYRYEIIEGEFVMPPAPYTIHQEIKGNIYFEMRKFINETKSGKIYDNQKKELL